MVFLTPQRVCEKGYMGFFNFLQITTRSVLQMVHALSTRFLTASVSENQPDSQELRVNKQGDRILQFTQIPCDFQKV